MAWRKIPSFEGVKVHHICFSWYLYVCICTSYFGCCVYHEFRFLAILIPSLVFATETAAFIIGSSSLPQSWQLRGVHAGFVRQVYVPKHFRYLLIARFRCCLALFRARYSSLYAATLSQCFRNPFS